LTDQPWAHNQAESTNTLQTAKDKTPFLQNWDAPVAPAILGLLSVSTFVDVISTPRSYNGSFDGLLSFVLVAVAILIAVTIWGLIHSIIVYPSLFEEKPKMKSGAAVSFINCLLGGVVFGLLWNNNLSKGKIGISFKVYSVLISLTCITVLIFLLYLLVNF